MENLRLGTQIARNVRTNSKLYCKVYQCGTPHPIEEWTMKSPKTGEHTIKLTLKNFGDGYRKPKGKMGELPKRVKEHWKGFLANQ